MEERKIRQLSPEIIGQIAAGEVVERPAAAIKELVENSIDAGATAVTVEIRDGGISFFRVADNGCGIHPEDIKLAFARHATSKIQSAEDLYGVQSLGFRGEALASIAAVSKVTCMTRTKREENGISVRNEGGVIQEIKDAACPEGTTFTIKELFFNAPVRLKFLKKPSTETAAVSELMARMILSHPFVSFRFLVDGKSVYFSPGDGKLKSAVMSIYGVETLKHLVEIHGNMNGVILEGFVGVGDQARGNRNHELFFLNGRTIKSAQLSSAVEEACRQRVTIGRFPICILHLTMPFEQTDVNVHPNKWEVRFQNEKAVQEAVETILREAFEKQDEAPVIPAMYLRPEKEQPKVEPVITVSIPEKKVEEAITQEVPPSKPLFFPPKPSPLPTAMHESAVAAYCPPPVITKEKPPEPFIAVVPPESPKETEQLESKAVREQFQQKKARFIGVVFNTYILLEYDDLMILCDQHAVHERLLYEKYMRETDTAPASQTLLFPLALHLSKAEYAAYEENVEMLRLAGFDLSPFGDDTVQIRGLPMILGQAQAESCLLEALDELTTSGTLTNVDRTSRIIQMACKHAVKGGERLPESSVLQLIQDIMEEKVPPTCPHGRPLMVQISHMELDKRFRRIQN